MQQIIYLSCWGEDRLSRFKLFILVGFFLLPTQFCTAASVRIGLDQSPPTSFLNEQGLADGFFPQLFNQVAKELNWSVSYIPCSWQQCLDKLSSGEIDILPGIAITDARSQEYRFGHETVLSSWGQIFTRSDDLLSSILELDGKKVAVLAGDVYFKGPQGLQQVSAQFNLQVDFVDVSDYDEAFRKLSTQQVDAAMVGRIFGFKNRQRYNLVPSSILIKPIQSRPAFSEQSPVKLTTDFDRLLAQWKQAPDSVYYRLIDRWLSEKTITQVPSWLYSLSYTCGGFILLLLAATFWTRKQVRIKTLQLAENYALLQNELATRHTIEKELLERQQQYQVFFENSLSSILFIDPENGAIVDANPAACQFYQYSRDQLKNMQISQINNLNEAELGKVLQQASNRKKQHFEFVHTRADGQTRQVEIYSTPIRIEGRTLLCSIIHDISQRKKAEQALAERNRFLQAVIDGVTDPLMVVGLDYQILQQNKAACEQFRRFGNAPLPPTCYEFSHGLENPCAAQEQPCPLQQIKETGQPVTVIHRHTTDQGQRILEITAAPLFNSEGELYAMIEVSRDISERMQIKELLNENEKRLLYLAHHDALTDLPNRLLFEDRLAQALSKARRSRRQVALFFLDLDNFKSINDNLGHDYGDQLLIDSARRLQKSVRESDTVARMGGDEFLVLLEDVDSIEIIEATVERIHRALSQRIVEGNFSQTISSSIGISIFPEDASTGQDLLKTADIAMYKAKKKGRANYQFYATPQARFLFD